MMPISCPRLSVLAAGSSGSSEGRMMWADGGSGKHYGGGTKRKSSAGSSSGGGPGKKSNGARGVPLKQAGDRRSRGRSAANLDSKRKAEEKYFWGQVEFRRGCKPGNNKRREFADSRREAKLFGSEDPSMTVSGLTVEVADEPSSTTAYDDIPVDVDAGPEESYSPLSEFSELLGEIDDKILLNCARCGYTRPTPIQRHAIPLAMCGRRDLLASAQTGSGKTAAFLLPMVSHALKVLQETEGKQPQAGAEGSSALHAARGKTPCAPLCLVMAPTRELAIQISEEAERLSWGTEARVSCVYGGSSAMPQLKQLACGPEILIATPGRLTDFVNKGFVSLEKVNFDCLPPPPKRTSLPLFLICSQLSSYIFIILTILIAILIAVLLIISPSSSSS